MSFHLLPGLLPATEAIETKAVASSPVAASPVDPAASLAAGTALASSRRRRRAASALETCLARALRPKKTGDMLWHQYPFIVCSGNATQVIQTGLADSKRASGTWRKMGGVRTEVRGGMG